MGPYTEQIARKREAMPERCRAAYDKAMSGLSRVMGIKVFCLECMGWSYKDSAACSTVECPLHPYLSRQDPTETGFAERQSTKGMPVVSEIAADSQESPVADFCDKPGTDLRKAPLSVIVDMALKLEMDGLTLRREAAIGAGISLARSKRFRASRSKE